MTKVNTVSSRALRRRDWVRTALWTVLVVAVVTVCALCAIGAVVAVDRLYLDAL